MNKNEETAWYDKARGKTAKKQKPRKEERTESKDAVSAKRSRPAKPAYTQARPEKPNKPKCTKPMFDPKNIPADSARIIRNFDSIAAEVLNLSSKQKILLARNIKELSHRLTDDRSDRRLGYMNDASTIASYVNYFMWWNLVRLTRLFSNLDKDALDLDDNSICLDIGSGPLTIPIALWLSRPDLRSKKITFYCMDLSQTALAAGEELYLSIASKTLKEHQEPWKIIRVKGALGTGIKEKADFITSGNMFNEIVQSSQMPSDFLAKKYTAQLLSYSNNANANAKILIVEPGDPHSARLVSLFRDSLMRSGFNPLAPCPHIAECPMQGRTTANPAGKWCNFAFDTSDAPEKLIALSKNANLSKDRAVLSFVLAKKTGDALVKPEKKSKTLSLRVASDFIRLTELHKSGYYACSEIGLVLAVDMSGVHPANGDLVKTKMPDSIKELKHDKKSGALMLSI
ncbi:MAG: small ribosomal subunit Rsm22 family protein [Treponema sp.]|nr:small ribosomal subunit Rsm22 family protein [Treponema sp.]